MIIPRYLGRELAATLVVVLAVLLAISAGGRFIGYLDDAVSGELPADLLWLVIGLRLPEFIQLILPFAAFMAALLVLGRLHAERELVVLEAAGLPRSRLLRWLLLASVPVLALVLLLSLWLTPMARAHLEATLDERARAGAFEQVPAGRFMPLGEDGGVVYAERLSDDRRTLEEVFIARPDPALGEALVFATSGRQLVAEDTGSRFLLLEDGQRHAGVPGITPYRSAHFAILGQRLEVAAVGEARLDEEAMDLATLRQPVPGVAGQRREAEWQWRLGLGLMVPVLLLAAAPLARHDPRAGGGVRIWPGLLLFTGYFVLLSVLRERLADGAWPALPGLWLVHLLAAALVAGLVVHDLGGVRAARAGASR